MLIVYGYSGGSSSDIPFVGCVNLQVVLGDQKESIQLEVPYLATPTDIDYPIVGFNKSFNRLLITQIKERGNHLSNS